MRIELEIPEHLVLLSDFELWHYVLNYWYVPASEREGAAFDRELRRHGLSYYHQKPLPNAEYHRRLEESWGKIFDLDWRRRGFARPRRQKSIQACLWEIEIDMVRDAKEFRAR